MDLDKIRLELEGIKREADALADRVADLDLPDYEEGDGRLGYADNVSAALMEAEGLLGDVVDSALTTALVSLRDLVQAEAER